MKRFIWLKEIYLTMAYELIVGVTIDIAKWFVSIKVTLSLDFWRAGFSYCDHMDTYWNEFSIIQDIWTLLSYFTFSFLSSFFSLFCFFNPVQRSRLQCKGKFISPYVLCFYKSSHHINVVLHTPSFLSNPSHILLKKSQALESFNDIYKQSK